MHIPHMYTEWLKCGLSKYGKTQVGLAKILHVDQSAISRMIKGERRIRADELPKIAAYIESNTPIPNKHKMNTISIVYINVIATAEGGNWREARLVKLPEGHKIPIVDNGEGQYGVLVSDASAGDEIQAGAYAICIPIDQLGRQIQGGDLLHVRCYKGGKIEISIREVSNSDDTQELRFPPPFQGKPRKASDANVEIVGIVTGVYSNRPIAK